MPNVYGYINLFIYTIKGSRYYLYIYIIIIIIIIIIILQFKYLSGFNS